MNIQIFGTKKCNDTKKAERYFKERGIKYQFVDMKEKETLQRISGLTEEQAKKFFDTLDGFAVEIKIADGDEMEKLWKV